MNPHKLWNDGAFFGTITGCLTSMFVGLIFILPSRHALYWPIVSTAAILLAGVVLACWYEARYSLNTYLYKRQEQIKAQEARTALPWSLSLDDEPVAAVPVSQIVLNPYDEYMRCCHTLWRLDRSDDENDRISVDELQRKMRIYWAQMTEEQRFKADVESGDAWKYACDDADQDR